MSFTTTLARALASSEHVQIGVGLHFYEVQGSWIDPRGEEAIQMVIDGEALLVHDQQIEVDGAGCAIVEDVDGIKHAIQFVMGRELREDDLVAQGAEPVGLEESSDA